MLHNFTVDHLHNYIAIGILTFKVIHMHQVSVEKKLLAVYTAT